MRVRLFESEDAPAVMAIQLKTLPGSEWRARDYLHLVRRPGGMILIADLETVSPPKVLGFIAMHRIMDEAEIFNIAVDPEHQHQGVARALLDQAKLKLRQAGAKRCFLEVRAGNHTALKLYYSAGFGLFSRRKHYYRDPPDDASVLSLELFPPAV